MLKAFFRDLVLPAFAKNTSIVVVALVLLVVTSSLSTFLVEIARSAVQVIDSNKSSEKGTILLQVLNIEPASGRWVSLAITAFLIATALWFSAYYRDIAFERVSLSVTRSLRIVLYQGLLRTAFPKLITLDQGILIKRIIEDAEQIRPLIIEAGLRRASDVLTLILMLAYIFYLSPLFGILSALSIAIFFSAAYWSAGLARGRLIARDQSRTLLIRSVTETLGRLSDVKISNKENWEARRFADLALSDEAISLRCVRWLLLDRSITGYFRSLGPIILFAVGGWAVESNHISPQDLLVIIGATSVLYGPVDSLSAVPITLRRVEVAARNLMLMQTECIEEENLDEIDRSTQSFVPDESVPIISARDVSFSYANSKFSLSVKEFVVNPGERVAIIGPSGSGKTTFIRILFGLLPHSEGFVFFLGNSLREVRLSYLRESVSYLAQEIGLFTGSIRDNIAYGAIDPDNVTDDDIIKAIRLAGIQSDIARMPRGVDTDISPASSNLSTGQKRRIGIARALMKNPSLLIFDEPFSNVSPEEREDILESLFSLGENRGVIVITHDHFCLDRYEAVYKNGRIDDGTSVIEKLQKREVSRAGIVQTGSLGL